MQRPSRNLVACLVTVAALCLACDASGTDQGRQGSDVVSRTAGPGRHGGVTPIGPPLSDGDGSLSTSRLDVPQVGGSASVGAVATEREISLPLVNAPPAGPSELIGDGCAIPGSNCDNHGHEDNPSAVTGIDPPGGSGPSTPGGQGAIFQEPVVPEEPSITEEPSIIDEPPDE